MNTKVIVSFVSFVLVAACVIVRLPHTALAAGKFCKNCPVAGVDSQATQALGSGRSGSTCSTGRGSRGYPVPDHSCTPGAFNPTVPPNVFGAKKFSTQCVRDCLTDPEVKRTTYKSYRISQNPSCELDHLVPLEMGGADSINNIWPQCGQAPDGRNYKDIKDRVEDYLAIQVLLRKMDLGAARTGIASDWAQYIDAEEAFCKSNSCDIAAYRK